MKIKSDYYYIIFIVGILLILIFGIIFFTQLIIVEHVENKISEKLELYEQHIEKIKISKIENLINYNTYLSNNKSLTDAVLKQDTEAVYSIYKELKINNDIDVLVVTDTSNILFKTENLNGINEISGLSKILTLLSNNFHKKEMDSINIWKIKNKHYMFYSSCIQIQDVIIGTVSAGHLIDNIFKRTEKNIADYTLIYNKRLLFSTNNFDNKILSQFMKTHRPIFDAVLMTSIASDMLSTIIEKNDVYAKILPFGYNIPAYFLISVSKNEELQHIESLYKYYSYVIVLCGLLIFIVFFFFRRRYKNQIIELQNSVNKLKEGNTSNISEDADIVSDLENIKNFNPKSFMGTILISDFTTDGFLSEIHDYSIEILNNLLDVQSECIELYGGKIESITNYKIISFFIGENESIDNALQCSIAIMKLISKESDYNNFQIGIGLSFGAIEFIGNRKQGIFGNTYVLADAIVNVCEQGQILIDYDLIKLSKFGYNFDNKKIWKFKNIKKEIEIVNVRDEIKR